MLFRKFMSKVSKRIDAMQHDTLMVAAAVLDPHTHYQVNLCNLPEYATALTVAIEKLALADPKSAVLAVNEVKIFRDCQGMFSRRLARDSALAGRMSPTEWWFQFGGEVPALQKYALRICSQCVSSSGCERNWSSFALVHTKQRDRLLYDKLHKLVSVHYNLKIRAEEDEVKEKDKEKKEVDPSSLLMDTTMFDETNPIMEWLNEDPEDPIVDGADTASAVFEQIRRLNSSRKSSHLGTKGNNTKRKRVVAEEDDFIHSEDDDQKNDEDNDQEIEYIDSSSESDEDDLPGQVEKDLPIQVEKETEASRNGNLENRRPSRQAKKTKDVNSLYYY